MTSNLQTLLGARIKKLRNSAGLTQAQLAERVDISDEFLSRMERGAKAPSLHTAEKVARALGVSMKELFDFDAVPAADSKTARLEGLVSYLAGVDEEVVDLVQAIARTVVEKKTA